MTSKLPWWLDERCHFGKRDIEDKFIQDRSDIKSAIDFISDLSTGSERNLLDLCCGPGRYAVELAMKGFNVVGVDISDHYLELGKQLAQQNNTDIDFIKADMRDLQFDNNFDVVINVGTSFGYFDDESDDRKTLDSIAKVLCPNGLLVLEMGNREYLNKHFLANERKTGSESEYVDIERKWSDSNKRIETHYTRYKSGTITEQWEHSWRAYSINELEAMLHKANFVIEQCNGGWDNSESVLDHPRLVLVARSTQAL